MKLTRRVLAVVIAAAMLVGVLAIGVNAATANSLTTYGTYDATENPYQAKLGLKVFRVDTDTEEYTEITDGKVNPGDVIRVELWGQTNYHTAIANYVMAYSNSFFTPTKLDYTTYNYSETAPAGLGASVVEQAPYDYDAAMAVQDVENEIGYSTYENPYPYNATADMLTSFAGGNNADTINSVYPSAWNGTASGYNIVMAGLGNVNPDLFEEFPGVAVSYQTKTTVISYYQPLVYFNLTVPENAQDGTSGTITIPEAAVRSSNNLSGRLYVAAGVPNDNYQGWDLTEAQSLASLEFDNIFYKDTYEDGTTMDRVIDLNDATVTLTVGEGGAVEPDKPQVDKTDLDAAIKTLPAFAEDEADPTTWAAYEEALADAKAVYADSDADQDAVDAAEEALLAAIAAVVAKPAVAPELVALGDTIIDEERGFIYGLPHADKGGTTDLVADGLVAVTGDGTAVSTAYNGNEFLGTGATLELKDSTGATVKTYTIIIFGDIDGDAMITDADAEDASYWYAWQDCVNDYEDLSQPIAFALDLDADGFITSSDLDYIIMYYAWQFDDILQTYEGQV